MYLWIKALHIISFVSWMAVLFYLPRLFVYHVEQKDKKDFVDVVKIMERRLYYGIGMPAFTLTLFSGLGLIAMNPSIFQSGIWIHIKLTAVILMIAYYFHNGYVRKKLERDECDKSGKFFRMYNEIPTILLIIIVIMAIVRPF